MRLLVAVVCVLGVGARPQSAPMERRTRRDATVIVDTTEMPATFQERLDAPIERIEIRLIDEQEHENSTSAHPSDSSNIDETVADSEQTATSDEENRTTHNKYRKVEYDLNTKRGSDDDVENEQISSEGEIQSRAWLSLSTSSPKNFGEDVIQLPPDADDDENPDDEPETVEECLLNKDQLPDEVVERLQTLKHKLSRMIRRLNKQQQQYCTDSRESMWTTQSTEYRQCPNWREEKMVQYYKFMRITYCSDMAKWPNASRVKREFEPKLHLYETMYAFQKSEIA